MRRPLISLLHFLAVIPAAFGSLPVLPRATKSTTTDLFPLSSPLPANVLDITPKQDTILLAAPDGSIHQLNISSGEIIWSMPTGRIIYDAYQSPDSKDDEHNSSGQQSNFYIDFGDDGQLHIFDKNSKTEVPQKRPVSIKELIGKTPIVSPHGVLIGSKNTSVFLVDPENGNVIYTFKSDADSEQGFIALKKGAPKKLSEPNNLDHTQHIFLKRIDYELIFLSANTHEILWKLSFADFDASRQCDGSLDVSKGGSLVQNIGQSNLHVLCVRDSRNFESFKKAIPMLAHNYDKKSLLPPDHESSLYAPALLPEFVLVDDPENPNQLVPYNPRIPRQYDDTHAKDVSITHGILANFKMWALKLLAAALCIFITLIVCCWDFGRRKQKKLNETVITKVQNVTPKKKKPRKSGNSRVGANSEKIMNVFHFTGSFERRIGKLVVSDIEIGKGSNGTIVLEGVYDARPVAVKRIVKEYHEVASKEIQNLIESDEHTNIVRWHGVEYDQDFVYIALERCICSLHELILPQTSSSTQVQSSMEVFKDYKLWKPNGYPSPELLKVMRDTASGLAHLHELGIIHRDLKPQNVLIRKDRSIITAKVSDMGISKRLPADMSSLTKSATGYGSSGWQAPEQLRNERQTCAVDLFSFGCVLFFCITGGRHPFGDSLERDVNIVNDRKDLFLIDDIPEAFDLITNLLHPIPEFRLTAAQVYHHPLFWNPELRLSFLQDVSNHVDIEDRKPDSSVLKALESIATVVLGGKWDEKLDKIVLKDVTQYRKYKYDSIRDLLRVIRNKSNHYRELPEEVQEVLGPVPTGFESYFSSRFPKLLMEVYKVLKPFCAEEELFRKYYKQGLC